MSFAFAGLLRGFAIYVEGVRLPWRVKGLRRLAIASTFSTLCFVATLSMLLPGFAHGRLVALGAAISKGLSTAVTVWSVFVLLFTLPAVGPVSAALQVVARERTRAAFAGFSLPGMEWRSWFFSVLAELARFHRRMLMLSLGTLVTVLSVVLVMPESMPRVRALISILLSLSFYALSVLFIRVEKGRQRAELWRRWPELLGFSLGSCGMTLCGLGWWFAVLNVVSAEVFLVRLLDPEVSVDVDALRERRDLAPTDDGPIPADVAERVRFRYQQVERTLTWDAEPPKTIRYEYLVLSSDPRPGEYQVGALLPTNEDDSLDLSEPIRFWIVVSIEPAPKDGRYRRYMDDRFAGPIEV